MSACAPAAKGKGWLYGAIGIAQCGKKPKGPHMPDLLCFGDSNTHGTPPIVTRGLYQRYDAATRWPTLACARLGQGWQLAEEGLPGRTAQFDDPVMGAHMDGGIGLKIALNSHGPLDVMTLMLGTNDCKTRFGAAAETITAGIAGLLDYAQGAEMLARHPELKILLICPPNILEQGPIAHEMIGAAQKSAALPATFGALAKARGCGFLDANKYIESSPTDGIHFEREAHAALALAVADAIRAL